jgi:hypothetical protein
MKLRISNFKYLLPLVCLVALTQWQGIPVAMSQELIEPVPKDKLISSIKLNRHEKNYLRKMTIPGYIRLINRYGVSFPLTADTEQEIRRAGEYFSAAELDKLVVAIRRNYRPDEPSEDEMKETLLRTMTERGGTRTANGVEINNIIAGGRANLENFEKLGCAPPNYGPGYFCTFTFSASVTMHSNERSESADRQIDAWNKLIRWLMGGNAVTETVTRKFVWIKDRWILTTD